MRVIEYNEQYRQKWSDFVKMNPQSTLYHDILWKTVLEKTFLFKSHYLICLDNSDNIAGILPLFETRDIYGKIYLVSIPFFTNAGICAIDKEATDQLLHKADEVARSVNAQYLELRHLAAESIEGLKSRDSFATTILKLNNDEDAIWEYSLNKMARRNVSKALHSGLKIVMDKGELVNFYKVYAHNMRDLGSPAMPLGFFNNIIDTFSDRADILLVKHKKKTIAGTLIIKHKKTLFDPFVSSLKKYNFLRPNNFMYWEAIKLGCRDGLAYFDLGRSTKGTGAFNFKLQWGAEPQNLSYQYIFQRSSRIPVCDALNNKYDLAIRIWKRLPIWLTNYVGPRIIRYLPEL